MSRAWAGVVVASSLAVYAACSDGRGSRTETLLDAKTELHDGMLEVPQVGRIDELRDMPRRWVEVGDVKLYVVEEGHGPTLVLINGGPGNTLHSFLPHFSRAAEFARVTYYDQRGTGLSDWKPAGGYSTRQAVDDLDALRERLGLEGWVVLGHSYGGLIAQRYALRYPERTAGLVLVSSSVPMHGLDLGGREFRTEAERARIRQVYRIAGAAVVPVHGGNVDLATLRTLVYNGYWNGDWKRGYFFKPSRERMAQIARYEWVHDRDFNAQLRADGYAVDLSGAFDSSSIPTLIIEGALDPNWGTQKPFVFAQQHPRARLVVVERAAHYPFAEQPEVFFRALRDFVEGLGPVRDPLSRPAPSSAE